MTNSRTPAQEFPTEVLSEVIGLIFAGLTTDGGHHKQFFLEEIARVLGISIAELDYEEGIAP